MSAREMRLIFWSSQTPKTEINLIERYDHFFKNSKSGTPEVVVLGIGGKKAHMAGNSAIAAVEQLHGVINSSEYVEGPFARRTVCRPQLQIRKNGKNTGPF